MRPAADGPRRRTEAPPPGLRVDRIAPVREHVGMVDSAHVPRSDTVPPAQGRDGLVAGAIAVLVVATVLIGVLVPAAPSRRAALPPGEDAACAEWNDGCRVCQRTGDGVACSLPGIACVPAEPRCLRRVGG